MEDIMFSMQSLISRFEEYDYSGSSEPPKDIYSTFIRPYLLGRDVGDAQKALNRFFMFHQTDGSFDFNGVDGAKKKSQLCISIVLSDNDVRQSVFAAQDGGSIKDRVANSFAAMVAHQITSSWDRHLDSTLGLLKANPDIAIRVLRLLDGAKELHPSSHQSGKLENLRCFINEGIAAPPRSTEFLQERKKVKFLNGARFEC